MSATATRYGSNVGPVKNRGNTGCATRHYRPRPSLELVRVKERLANVRCSPEKLGVPLESGTIVVVSCFLSGVSPQRARRWRLICGVVRVRSEESAGALRPAFHPSRRARRMIFL